jgi:hypothetical protein
MAAANTAVFAGNGCRCATGIGPIGSVARTYAYVSAGKNGVAIVDVEKPEQPKLDQMFTGDGKLTDVRDIKIGMVDASAFAFVADGRNGLRVLQILSPEDSPNSYGFSPRPTPKLIATY